MFFLSIFAKFISPQRRYLTNILNYFMGGYWIFQEKWHHHCSWLRGVLFLDKGWTPPRGGVHSPTGYLPSLPLDLPPYR